MVSKQHRDVSWTTALRVTGLVAPAASGRQYQPGRQERPDPGRQRCNRRPWHAIARGQLRQDHDSPNRAVVVLVPARPVDPAGGARIDLRHGTDTATGNEGAPWHVGAECAALGADDIAIDASGHLTIAARDDRPGRDDHLHDAPIGTSPTAAAGRIGNHQDY